MSGWSSFVSALHETVRNVFTDDPPQQAELFRLAKEQHFREALDLLKAHPQLWAARDGNGHSLLHWASLGGSVPFVSSALAAGIPIDVQASSQQTPVMWAVCGGHVPMVKALLDADADPLVRNATDETLLMIAVQHQKADVMPLLVERGREALLGARDQNGCTAAHWAAHSGSASTLGFLESVGLDLHALDSSRMSPLHRAVLQGHIEAADFLIQRHSDPALCNAAGHNCFDIADARRDSKMQLSLMSSMMKWLLKQPTPAGAPLNSGHCLATSIPLVIGVAISRSEAWLHKDGESQGGAAPERAELEGRAPDEHSITGSSPELCTHFDIEECSSWEQCAQLLLKHVEAANIQGASKHSVLCCLVTDAYGATVNMLSRTEHMPSSDRFPLRATVIKAQGVCSQELRQLGPMLCTSISQRMQAQPYRFYSGVLTRAPPGFRWHAWKEVLPLDREGLPPEGFYAEACERENEWSELIRIDIGRTFAFFDAPQQQCLFRVLNAYAVHKPEIGYCQGMNFIAGVLLHISGREAGAFGAFACLMDEAGLSGFYREGFPLLRCYVEACDQLMVESVPELRQHFCGQGLEHSMYLQQWFLTLFIDCLPLSVVVTIWDVIVSNGLIFALNVAVAILRAMQDQLLLMRSQDITKVFKLMKSYTDEDDGLKGFRIGSQLVRLAESVSIPRHIETQLRHNLASLKAGGECSPMDFGAPREEGGRAPADPGAPRDEGEDPPAEPGTPRMLDLHAFLT